VIGEVSIIIIVLKQRESINILIIHKHKIDFLGNEPLVIGYTITPQVGHPYPY
jgi:hypothetical protein